MQQSSSSGVYAGDSLKELQKSQPESKILYQDFLNDDADWKPQAEIKEDASSDTDDQSDVSGEDSSDENTHETTTKRLKTPALQKAKAVIKTQKLKIKTLNQQIRRAHEKINLQNKVLNDLMEIYGLKHEDIAVLKSEILRAEKLQPSENVPET